MILVTISSGAGRTIGSCVQATTLSMAGVLVGSAFFAILAKLAHVPVAQGIVFAAFVYGKYPYANCNALLTLDHIAMSLIKTRGQRWFSFSLLSILMAFNGVGSIYSFIQPGFIPSTKLLQLDLYVFPVEWCLQSNLSTRVLEIIFVGSSNFFECQSIDTSTYIGA
jgi:hypothetical protein